jgi:hypothetical protein
LFETGLIEVRRVFYEEILNGEISDVLVDQYFFQTLGTGGQTDEYLVERCGEVYQFGRHRRQFQIVGVATLRFSQRFLGKSIYEF